MTLSTVLNQFKIVFLAKFTYFICVCNTTIKVDDSNSLGFRSEMRLYQVVINLQCVRPWLYKNWYQPIFCNSQDGSNVSICWNDDFITSLHYT